MSKTLQNLPYKNITPLLNVIKLTLTLLLFFCAGSALAQDVIYSVKGTEINCKVQEIGEDSVSYSEFADASAKIKLILKKEVAKIKYANGYEEVYNSVVPATPAPKVAAVAGTTGTAKSDAPTTGDVIFTTDGNQLKGKVTDIDEATISYTLAGGIAEQKVDIKNVLVIKYANGYEEFYNTPGVKPKSADANNTAKADDNKNSMFIVLQNWKRKYIAPPLQIL